MTDMINMTQFLLGYLFSLFSEQLSMTLFKNIEMPLNFMTQFGKRKDGQAYPKYDQSKGISGSDIKTDPLGDIKYKQRQGQFVIESPEIIIKNANSNEEPCETIEEESKNAEEKFDKDELSIKEEPKVDTVSE